MDGRYDAVLSVEMIEAVGYRFWPTYFQTLERLVAPGGRVAIQAITMPHDRMLATRNTYTWIQKYIFPGGLLPSTEAIIAITERHTQLRTVDMLSLRPHYAETLRLWRERFRAPDAVAALGFDDVFQRMWELYLAYSEAGFGPHISMCTNGPSHRRGGPMNFVAVSARRWRSLWWCTASPLSSAGGSAATTSSTSRGVWVSSRWQRSPPTGHRRPVPPDPAAGLVTVWGCAWPGTCTSSRRARARTPLSRSVGRRLLGSHVLRKVFVIQAAATWFVSLPLQLSAVSGPTPAALWPVLIAGVVLWVVGVAFEALGDHQLRFQADPPPRRGDGPRPVGMDPASQLFRRRVRVVGAVAGDHHRVAFAVDGGLTGADDYFLVYATGARRTEQYMEDRPGFAEYRSRIVFRAATAQIAITVTTLAAAGWATARDHRSDELLRQVARDADAFATFYDRTRARVFGMVTRVLRDPGYSEETTQDIYLQVWRTAGSYDPPRARRWRGC